jgi:hypothetical protein
MGTNEWILVVQTATMLVLVWYAWETRKIRLDSTHQNKLISEQIAVMQRSLEFELEKEAKASEPLLRFEGCGGSSGSGVITREFANDGAPITDLSIHTPTVKAEVWGCLELTDRKLGRILNGQSHDTINPQDPS